MTQAALFEPKSPIDEAIDRALERGQRVTDWQRSAMQAWAQRNVTLPSNGVPEWEKTLWTTVGVLPMPCDCTECHGGAVIFPPEAGAPRGFCVCPTCSLKQTAGASS